MAAMQTTTRFGLAPIAPTAQRAQRAQAQSDCLTSAPLAALRGARVLVVDDNPLNRDLAREMLEDVDLSLDTAGNGREALAAVRARDYDVVFMDVQMPVMDGFAATRAILDFYASGPRPDRQPPVIVAISAHAGADHVHACLEAGMDDYLGKPFHRQGLLESIARSLPRQSALSRDPDLPNSMPGSWPCSLPGVDMDDAMVRFDGNTRMFQRFLLAFQDEFEDYDSEILLAAAMGDFDTAARLAHTLAGAAANVSAHAVQVSAKALQEALQTRTLRITPQLEALRQALACLCEAVGAQANAHRT